MSEHESFVAAIAAAPDDDTPRLVYADFLEEHGDAVRAGFIRDQVRLTKLRPGTDEYRQLFRRTADTLKANLPAWIQSACDAFAQPAVGRPRKSRGSAFGIDLDPMYLASMEKGEMLCLSGFEFIRGFIGQADVHFAWLNSSAWLDQLLRDHPVTRLTANCPMSQQNWQNTRTARLNQIRNLTLGNWPSEKVANAFLNDEVWHGVSRLTLHLYWDSSGIGMLCSSSLAKQLLGLRVHFTLGMFTELARFPLDDRLQEFAILRSMHELSVPGHPRRMTDISDLSAVAFRPTLKRLDLTGCTIGDRGLGTFARGDVWVRLRALVLDRNRFGDPGWRDFVRSRRTPELALLSASRNFVTGDGAARLAQSPLAATLQYADLRGNRIDGKGAVALARAFGDGPLKKLLLAGNPIGPREAETVRKILGGRVDVG